MKNKLKVISNDVKGNILEIEKQEYIKKKRPKYIKIVGVKILTPKQIVRIPTQVPGALVFGDPRCSSIKIKTEELQRIKKEKKVVIALRVPRSKKADLFVFSHHIDDVMKFRKVRLANAINFEKVYSTDENDFETAEQFMKSELGIEDSEISGEELEIKFLSSVNDNLLIGDIERLIQGYYQDNK